jgi:hypothetical protein
MILSQVGPYLFVGEGFFPVEGPFPFFSETDELSILIVLTRFFGHGSPSP